MASITWQKAEYRQLIEEIMAEKLKSLSAEELLVKCLRYHGAYTETLSVSQLKSLHAALLVDGAKRV